MKNEKALQLAEIVDTSNHRNIIAEVRNIFLYHYPQKYFTRVRKCYSQIVDLFNGNFPGYRSCNTDYHNLNHTLNALLACSRLVDGYNLIRRKLPLSLATNLFNAALFHDSGYIQRDFDKEGTGAKYTRDHVERSIAFLVKHAQMFEIEPEEVIVISRLIKCTHLSTNINKILFNSLEEKITGSILGTADLLGQMSDRIYLEKLLFLYNEFKEAGIEGFNTEYDIIRKTIDFYKISRNKFNNSYMNVYRYGKHHFRERYGIDKNLYIEAINRQITYLQKIIKDDTRNFRHKLNRFREDKR